VSRSVVVEQPDLDPEEPASRLLADLHTRRDGLASSEAARRLQQVGPNAIRRERGPGAIVEVVRQLMHPLALLLWAAAALALVSHTVALAAAIVGVILLNALFSFVQERQAERATEALREFLPPRARVRRDGEVAEVDATDLVPGDLLLLSEGDRLSADARLIAGAVEVDLSPLTGESVPVTRRADRTARRPTHAGPLEAEDLVFAGALCTGGEAEAVVYATAMHTQLGRIAALSQRVKADVSPLQRQVNHAARMIAFIALALGGLFFVVGTLVAGLPLADATIFAVGLIVANVPEGLLPTITLALAVGVRRMARRRALVKRLTAVETLGSTDVVCTDKTGTLTEGQMALRSIWTVGDAGDEAHRRLLQVACRCTNATVQRVGDRWERSGDPSESALLIAGAEAGLDIAALQTGRPTYRQRLYAFDPRRKRMSTLDRGPDGSLALNVKGAPLELLERCDVDAAARERVAQAFRELAGQGLRVLGVARRSAAEDALQVERADDAEQGLTFLGLVALYDPPRPDVAAAVADCHTAGIRIVVITGDHGLTAEAVAREVGIVDGPAQVVQGPDLDAMTDPELDAVLATSPQLIVARSSPETKLRIVDALRAQGHTVAMTGDGVNDAPALRRADIGVAMGASGTDVAREAATMVLTDDNFASIVAAVREGRTVYENIRKFVVYIFAHATPEVVPFLVFALSGGAIPLPLTALQILAIDLGTETLPALALGREPAEPDLMRQPPRSRRENILTRPMLVRAWVWLGLLEAALVMGGFLFVLLRAGWTPGAPVDAGAPLHEAYVTATAMTFAGITACQIGTAFAARTNRASLRTIGVFSNRLLLWGIAFEIAFAAAVIYLPALQALFATAALGGPELALLVPFPFVVWGSDELRRWWRRRTDAQGRDEADRGCRVDGARPGHDQMSSGRISIAPAGHSRAQMPQPLQ
jgi:calcium-translocating P-type ATPase